MDHTSFVLTVFSAIVIILLSAIWSNAYVYAQQPSSPSPTSASLQLSSSAADNSTIISPQLKAKMCNPSNPSLKAVNTTEARICGIPKTIKSPALSSAASSTSSAVPSTTPQQTTTTKPTAAATLAAAALKQQQITTTNNNTKPVSGTTGAKVATIVPVGNLSNRSLSASLPPPSSPIAPQLNAINQEQQQQQPQLLTISNGTAGQNYTFSSNSPLLDSGKLIYLGYNGGSTGSTDGSSSGKNTIDTKSSHDSSTSKDKGRSDNKSAGHKNDGSSSHTKSSDNKSAGHKNDGGKPSSSKTTSKSKDHIHHDSNESNKGKKKSSSKGNSNHKRGDSFFDGDPFF
jgi:hypothetical protein